MVEPDDEVEVAENESDASDDEEPMETDSKTAQPDVSVETDTVDEQKDAVSTEASVSQAKKMPSSKPPVVATGLPRSKEELESLISAIHQTVNGSVLPRLHKCLTAKVYESNDHLLLLYL